MSYEPGTRPGPLADRLTPERDLASPFSRRALFMGALTAGAALAAPTARAQVPDTGNPGDAPPPDGSPVHALTLLDRVTYFPRGEDVQRIQEIGYTAYLEEQLNPAAINDSACERMVGTLPTIGMPPFKLVSFNGTTARTELATAAMMRAVHSKRQLFERMVEFWNDHLNVHFDTVGGLKTVEDREVIRRHALGRFEDLVLADAKSPAMMLYLNTSTNRVGRPNLNYGRELMELHTLGVGGGYTEQDVTEIARCFTGWSYGTNSQNYATYGLFTYTAGQHDQGAKTVLGQAIPANGGLADGEQAVRIVCRHPSTARFVSTKLIKFFVDPAPADDLVNSVTNVWVRTQGDIKAVMRAVLSEGAMLRAKPKYKRPFHLVASALRAISPTLTNHNSLVNTWLPNMGHSTFRWAPPNGFPDTFGYWSGLILPRWNVMFSMLNSNVSGVSVNANAFVANASTVSTLVQNINARLFRGAMDQTTRDLLTSYATAQGMSDRTRQEAVALALSSPQFQWF